MRPYRRLLLWMGRTPWLTWYSSRVLVPIDRFLYQRSKLACEAAGAVPTAALLAGIVDLPRGSTVVSVVSVPVTVTSEPLVNSASTRDWA